MPETFDPDHPLPDAYWVVPGRLLAGPYPVSGQERVARRRVLCLLGAGVTLFLDLTQEGELSPYAHLLDDAARHVRRPIPDLGVPSVGQMAEALDVIDVAIGAGYTVYVHCRAGLGRTGTVVGCFLVRHGMSGAEALRTIRMLRRDTLHAGSESPETEVQRWMVLSWKNGR